MTALFDGQRVIGPARDIQEVRNAITAYEALPRWDPSNPQHLLEAHGLLMAGLIDAPGRFRNGGVGIDRGDQLVPMAPPAARVPGLIAELLAWLAASTWQPLIASCVAHDELEFIHPFADGNGGPPLGGTVAAQPASAGEASGCTPAKGTPASPWLTPRWVLAGSLKSNTMS